MGEVAVEIDERIWKSFEGEILKSMVLPNG